MRLCCSVCLTCASHGDRHLPTVLSCDQLFPKSNCIGPGCIWKRQSDWMSLSGETYYAILPSLCFDYMKRHCLTPQVSELWKVFIEGGVEWEVSHLAAETDTRYAVLTSLRDPYDSRWNHLSARCPRYRSRCAKSLFQGSHDWLLIRRCRLLVCQAW